MSNIFDSFTKLYKDSEALLADTYTFFQILENIDINGIFI